MAWKVGFSSGSENIVCQADSVHVYLLYKSSPLIESNPPSAFTDSRLYISDLVYLINYVLFSLFRYFFQFLMVLCTLCPDKKS